MIEIPYSVYCAGPTTPCVPGDACCWSDAKRHLVAHGCRPHDVAFLNPCDNQSQTTETNISLGENLFQIMSASAIIVDLSNSCGISTGIEMAAAAAMGVPIVVVIPPGSHYAAQPAQSNTPAQACTDPHIAALATYIVANFMEAGQALATFVPYANRRATVPLWLEPAIAAYEHTSTQDDQPMVEAMSNLANNATL